MNIVLAGAGEVGLNLARSLAHENHNISIIDHDKDHLEYIATNVDVLTVHGDASSICLLYTSPSPRDATLSRMPSSA